MFYEKIEFNLEAVHSTGQHCKYYRSTSGFCEEHGQVNGIQRPKEGRVQGKLRGKGLPIR